VPQYVCEDLEVSGENMPTNVSVPSGWEWVEEDWIIDKSKSFGHTDEEGWVYGTSFEKIQQAIMNLSTTGVKSTTALFRKRRWYRNCKCVSKEIIAEIDSRISVLHSARKDTENIIRIQQQHADSVAKFEQQRTEAHTSTFKQCAGKIADTDTNLTELGEQLKKLRQFAMDVATIEKEHSRRTTLLSQKYRSATSPLQSTPPAKPQLTANSAAQQHLQNAQQFDSAYEDDCSDDDYEGSDDRSAGKRDSDDEEEEVEDIGTDGEQPVQEQQSKQEPEVEDGEEEQFAGGAKNNNNGANILVTPSKPTPPVATEPTTPNEASTPVIPQTPQQQQQSAKKGKSKGHTANFFDIFCSANDAYANVLQNFSSSMNSLVLQDIDALVKEINDLSRDCKQKLKGGR
jgi:hypothetical protein